MLAIIPGKSLRLFAGIIKALAKTGEEITIEVSPQKLTFKTLNQSLSAYFNFFLLPGFFETYRVEEDLCIKSLLKPCLSAFKSTNDVERCTMAIYDNDQPRLVFELSCKHGVRKTFKLNVEPGRHISATYTTENSFHRVLVQSKLLEDCIANFSTSAEEVSWTFGQTEVKMKCGMEDTSGRRNGPDRQIQHDPIRQGLHTELALAIDDFDKYEIKHDVDTFELIFSLKELRVILAFNELTSQPLQIFSCGPGTPIVFSVKIYNIFEADFVIATLQNSQSSSQKSSGMQSQATAIPPSTPLTMPQGNYTSQSGASSQGLSLGAPNSKQINTQTQGNTPNETPSYSSQNSLRSGVSGTTNISNLNEITPAQIQPQSVSHLWTEDLVRKANIVAQENLLDAEMVLSDEET